MGSPREAHREPTGLRSAFAPDDLPAPDDDVLPFSLGIRPVAHAEVPGLGAELDAHPLLELLRDPGEDPLDQRRHLSARACRDG